MCSDTDQVSYRGYGRRGHPSVKSSGGFLMLGLGALTMDVLECVLSFSSITLALEEEMATHSSVLAWRIPGTAGPGGLPSMGSHRVGHD